MHRLLTMPTVLRRVVVQRGRTRHEKGKEYKERSDDDDIQKLQQLLKENGFLRFIILELWVICFFLLFVVLGAGLVYHELFLKNYLKSLTWDQKRQDMEETMPAMVCESKDLTTSNSSDFSFDSNTELHTAVDTILQHGLGLFPDILSAEAASNLRDYVLFKNQYLANTQDELPVIEFTNRWSFAFDPTEDERIAPILHQIGSSPLLKHVLEELLGSNPAVVELSAITSAQGADHQFFHSDTNPEASAHMYGNSFSPMYSLLIPLQDTTPAMGATAVCPGSHKCIHFEQCDELGFQPEGTWNAGTALLYNSQMRHRGSANRVGPHRSVLIISFVSRPSPGKQLPSGGVYAMRWQAWGLTWRELENAHRLKSTVAYALELRSDAQGWSALKSWAVRIRNAEYRFRIKDLQDTLKNRWGWLGKVPRLFWGDLSYDVPFQTFLEGVHQKLTIFCGVVWLVWGLATLGVMKKPQLLCLCAIHIFILVALACFLLGRTENMEQLKQKPTPRVYSGVPTYSS